MNKKVLIVGGAGYIGGCTTDLLQHKNYDVGVFDNLIYETRYLKDVKFFYGDIRDTNDVIKAAKNYDTVVLMAALVGDPACAVDVNLTDEINHIAIKNICEQLDLSKHVIFLSTCHDDKTLCYTNHGIKNHDEITMDDMVLTINMTSNKIEWKPIKRIIIKEYNGELISIAGRRVSLNITPEHNLLIKSNNKNIYKPAEEIFLHPNHKFLTTGIWEGKRQERFIFNDDIDKDNIPQTIEMNDLMFLIGLFIGDGYINYSSKLVKNKSGHNKADFLKKCRDKNGKFTSIQEKGEELNSVCNGYRTHFCLPKNDPTRHDLIEILNKYNIKYYETDIIVGISSKRFYDFFNQFGDGAKEKHIPKLWLEYDSSLLKSLFNGLIYSDGNNKAYRNGKMPMLFTSSFNLLNSVIELGYKLSYSVGYNKKQQKSIINGRNVMGDIYNITFSKTDKTISKKNVSKLKYSNKVWCLEIEDNHNFLVVRNGKINFSGNCSVYGAQLDILNENSPTNPLSAYASTKLMAEKYVSKRNGTIFRLGTVYGLGDPFSRIRLDLVVNVLTMKAVYDKKIHIFGGEQWRPLICVKDVAGYIEEAIRRDVRGTYILSEGNYTMKELGEIMKQKMPEIELQLTDIKFEDARNYKVDGKKTYMSFEYTPRHTIPTEIEKMRIIFEEHRICNINEDTYHNGNFIKNKWIKKDN